MPGKDNILVIGANGQLGSELVAELQSFYGEGHVIATDISSPSATYQGIFEHLDATDAQETTRLVEKYNVTQIYLLAAILSARGEQNPRLAWNINMPGLLNVLNIAVEQKIKKVYWPSSIAVFGPETPKHHTPQHTVMQPNTVYGISKLSGELWCQYYHQHFGVDVRSLRYPGLIGYKGQPGGGTTDYAVDIFHKAVKGENFECFLQAETELPMMYMADAIRATIELMEAPADSISIRTSYNIQGISFTPAQIHAEIQRIYPSFEISYKPDFRQKIADSWPASINDEYARNDWNWKTQYDLKAMTEDMIANLERMLV